jgi:uncharacterized membrane protein YecN with MAPEG domain
MVRLEIAAVYIGINILLLVALSVVVVLNRRGKKIALGDNGDSTMLRAVRAHANAAENIPAGLIGLLTLSLLDPAGPTWVIHAIGAAFTAGRVLHGIGLNMGTLNAGRTLGMALTYAAYISMALGLISAGFAQQL